MNILLVHHWLPWPATSGRDKVSFNLIKAVSLEHNVTVVCPIGPKTLEEDIAEVRKICSKLITVPISAFVLALRRSQLFRLVKVFALVIGRVPMHTSNEWYPAVHLMLYRLCRKRHYDCFQVTSNVAAGYLRAAPAGMLRIMGPMDDSIESLRSSSNVCASRYVRLVERMMARAIRWYETRWTRCCERVFFHSTEDMERFSHEAGGLPKARVIYVPTEITEEAPTFIEPEPHHLVFVAGFGSSFNADAAVYLAKTIFPLIREAVPDATLSLVGQSPGESVKRLANDPGIKVTGAVADVDEYIARASVSLCTVRAGTGIKTKTIEALRVGRPVVSTRAGVQGLWAFDDDAIIIRDDPVAFADAVIALLKDPVLAAKAALKARALYESAYTFAAAAQNVLAAYREIAESL